MPRLEIKDPDFPTDFEIVDDVTTIGRRPDNKVVLRGGTVSGRHAEIRKKGEEYVLADVGSRNGTFLNRDRLISPTSLMHNDEIYFGSTEAVFVHPGAATRREDKKRTVYGGGTVSGDDGLLGETPSSIFSTKNGMSLVEEESQPAIDSALKLGGHFGGLEASDSKKLQAVLKISQQLAGTTDLDAFLPTLLQILLDLFPFADRGFVLLKEESGELMPHAMLHRREQDGSTIRLSKTILNRVLEEKSAILSKDATNEPVLREADSIVNLQIRSMMCVPMLSLKGEPIGIISLDSQNRLGQFTDEDLELMVAVAGQAALSYENARLFQAFLEKEKQDFELGIARNVQRALLPEHLRRIQDYTFYASYDAAREVGGDYYDFLELPNGQVCVSLGDVAGKGVPGALVMSRMHSCVQNTMQHVTDAVTAMNAINVHMSRNSSEGRFVTFVLCILDPETHELTVANAGHPSPLIRRRDGSIESFDEERFGAPIGVFAKEKYQAETRVLEPGDTVVIITDGVDEAMNESGELYGHERTVEFIRRAAPDPGVLGQGLLNDVKKHAAGFPQSDDITIFCFGRSLDE